MKRLHKTKRQFLKELEDMRRKLEELEACRLEYRNVQTRYNKLLESAPDAMVFVNKEGRIVRVNAQTERLFGYAEEELVGRKLATLIPERFRERHRRNVETYFANPRVRPMGTNLEIYALKKDGSEFPADISLSPLEVDGEILATAAVRDITERKRAKDQIEMNYHIQRVIGSALKISLEPVSLEEQLDRILDLILTLPLLSLESKGLIYLAEDESDVFELKAQRGFSETEPPCERVSSGRCICGREAPSCVITHSGCIVERQDIHYGGEFPRGHYCVPILSGGKALGLMNVFVKEGRRSCPEEEEFLGAVSSTIAGILERRRAEREKERLREQLVQSEKLSALGRITANVAHEIRNPLTSIGGFARRLHKKIAEGAKEKEYVDSIIDEVSRLEEILRNVLAFSRSTSLRLEDSPIQEIIEKALELSSERFRERSIFVERSYGDIPHIRIDREQVLEALERILDNAADAMPAGGTLNVITDKELLAGTPHVAVKIKDTGGGIPEEKIAMIFEPFFTTKVTVPGLGLSIARKIVEEHGGTIRIESKVGQGSTVSLYFPCDA